MNDQIDIKTGPDFYKGLEGVTIPIPDDNGIGNYFAGAQSIDPLLHNNENKVEPRNGFQEIIRLLGDFGFDLGQKAYSENPNGFIEQLTKLVATKYFQDLLRTEEDVLIPFRGGICRIIKNSHNNVGAIPILVSNIKNPRVHIYRRLGSATDVCYRLSGETFDNMVDIYLDGSKLNRHGYIIKKFNEVRVTNSITPETTAMHLYQEFLKSCAEQTIDIPEKFGWYEGETGFELAEEGDMTWSMIRTLMK